MEREIWRNSALQVLFLWILSMGIADARDCDIDQYAGKLVSVENTVTVVDVVTAKHRRITSATIESDEEAALCIGDEILVGTDGRAALLLEELNAIVRLDSDSHLRLGAPPAAPPQSDSPIANTEQGPIEYCLSALSTQWLRLRRGALRLFTTQQQQLKVHTPYMNASIEGTEFVIQVSNESTRVDVVQGVVAVCNTDWRSEGANLLLNEGESALSIRGAPPVIVSPDNAVQWALHYPRVDNEEALSVESKSALASLQSGQGRQALVQLKESRGAFELALSSIIRITLNELSEAKRLAKDAIDVDATEPTAWLSQSYVQQANFQTEAALKSVQRAFELSPTRADIRARLAELLLITGQAKEAYVVAQESVAISPDVGRVHAVLGFLHLGRDELREAMNSFEQAKSLDDADPFPRLGLALAFVRIGMLSEARREMQIAVNLQPNNSLLRSYLGRLYLELNHPEQAAEQLTLAEQFDPNDPTPLLFEALLAQRAGQPVEALRALQASATRVNRRAVYRSRSALDEDMAVALASGARIYQELGFTELARLNGVRSLHRDPGSYSGHRLMADVYLQRPRHELARQSEILQAQLHQPLNNNPSQLRLADQRLGAFRDSGPFAASFGEYSRLFSREGVNGRIGIQHGSHNARRTEVQLAGLRGSTSLALTGYFFNTDGIADNRDENLGIASGLFQFRASARLDLQFEYEVSNFETGENLRSFLLELYDRNDRNEERTRRSRYSAHWRPRQKSSWLLNVEKASLFDLNTSLTNAPIRSSTDGIILDVQHRRDRSDGHRLAGAVITREQQSLPESTQDNDDTESITQETRLVTESGLYWYQFSTRLLRHQKSLDLLWGIGFEQSSGRDRSKLSINPKFGISLEAGRNRWRATVFRSSRRSLIAARTLEPSNVMGFPQLIEQKLVDHSTVVGFGVDHQARLSNQWAESSLSLGFEISHRLTKHASDDGTQPNSEEFESRMYAYGSSGSNSLALELRSSDWQANQAAQNAEQIRRPEVRTHRIMLDYRNYWGKGHSISLRPQYIKQEGNFYNYFLQRSAPGIDEFVVTDLALMWNLGAMLNKGVIGHVSLTVANLFDERFRFQDEDPSDPQVAYERRAQLRLQLSIR